MAIVERKRVTLHPLKEDGTVDPKVCLYPKTFVDGIVNRDGDLVKVATAEDLEEKVDREELDNYATKEELTEKANNAEVVHLDGDEEISGRFNFIKHTSDSEKSLLINASEVSIDEIEDSTTAQRSSTGIYNATGVGISYSEKDGNITTFHGIGLNNHLLSIIEETGNDETGEYTETKTVYQRNGILYDAGKGFYYEINFPEKSGTIALEGDTPGGKDKRNNKWDKLITKFTTLDLIAPIHRPDGQMRAATLENKVIFTNNTDHDLYLAFGHDYGKEINNRKSEYNKDGNSTTLGKQKYYSSRYDLIGQPKELNSAKCIAPGESVTLWDLLEPDHFYDNLEEGTLNAVGEKAQNIGLWNNSKVIAYYDQIRDFYETYYYHNDWPEKKWEDFINGLISKSKYGNACDKFGFCIEVNNTNLHRLNKRISVDSNIVSKSRSKPKVVHALLGSRNATKKIYICERIVNKEDDERAGYRCGKVYMALQLHIGTLAMTAAENEDEGYEKAVRRFITFSFRPFFTETYKKEPFNVYFKRTLGPIKG